MSVRRVQVDEYTCEQCAYVWRARTPKAPDMCPRCHTRLYDRPGPRTEGAPWSREKGWSESRGSMGPPPTGEPIAAAKVKGGLTSRAKQKLDEIGLVPPEEAPTPRDATSPGGGMA